LKSPISPFFWVRFAKVTAKKIMPGIFFEMLIQEPIKPNPDFKKYVGTEDNFQKAVARYLDTIGAFWFHCPNGGSRNAIEASKLKGMGVAIELKVGYNKPSESQMEVMDKLVHKNWLVIVCWSLDEVITMIDWYYENQ